MKKDPKKIGLAIVGAGRVGLIAVECRADLAGQFRRCGQAQAIRHDSRQSRTKEQRRPQGAALRLPHS